ncbi:MAG: nitronate monooxygenase [Gemmatimonadales bacterium]
MHLPLIIQGGMGAAISGWCLARAVSLTGQLGVVSGTGIDTVLVRRLQDGDPGGHLRRAIEAFPMPDVAGHVSQKYFRAAGRAPDQPYLLLPLCRQVMSPERQRLLMLATFAEVWLAKEGHDASVGINLLTKIQLPTLAALYGAMLAGVDWVLMGAGIPRDIPGALDLLASGRATQLRLDVEDDQPGREAMVPFDPSAHFPDPPALRRPGFIAIVASNSLATMLARKASGMVDGFVVERPTAGGHNAPPRGPLRLSDRGEPLYGDRDVVDLSKLGELGRPFWLAGGAGRPGVLAEARREGAAGIQVGTLFAYCDESGLAPDLKQSIIHHALQGAVQIRTDPRASPTGYPFKVVEWPDDPARGVTRERRCDLGYLRVAYRRDDGRLGYRCAGEPVEDFVAKGGRAEDTVGRKCLCNTLLATAGHPQARGEGWVEPPLVTSGDDVTRLHEFLGERTRYAACDVVEYLLS